MSLRFVRSPAAPKMTMTQGGAVFKHASEFCALAAMGVTLVQTAVQDVRRIFAASQKEAFLRTCVPYANESACTARRSEPRPVLLLRSLPGSSSDLRPN